MEKIDLSEETIRKNKETDAYNSMLSKLNKMDMLQLTNRLAELELIAEKNIPEKKEVEMINRIIEQRKKETYGI